MMRHLFPVDSSLRVPYLSGEIVVPECFRDDNQIICFSSIIGAYVMYKTVFMN